VPCVRQDLPVAGSRWGATPRQSVQLECERRGDLAVVRGCRALLRGEDVDPEFVLALGGPPARWAVTGDAPGPEYWTRVWAARGLLWIWNDEAVPELAAALKDPAWRVRETGAKVVGRHRVDDLLEPVAALRNDPVQRVAAAASRAIIHLGSPR